MTAKKSKLLAKTESGPDNPYLLLTPGPLSTSPSVRAAMLRDWCTWDDDYNQLVQSIRRRLVSLAAAKPDGYTSVLIQGSGTFCVEAVISSAVPKDGKLLVLTNGAYGDRIAKIANVHGIPMARMAFGEMEPVNPDSLVEKLEQDTAITHVAVVHCETTTGMLNPLEQMAHAVKRFNKILIVDAMSSFGGIPLDAAELGADFLVSSANKCIQGVPGFGFVIAKTASLEACKGQARSLSLDLYDQWETMEKQGGKWRFTSPTHTVRAFYQALVELEQEGGVGARNKRYADNQRLLVEGMEGLGFSCLLPARWQSPIITSFRYPDHPEFRFETFYERLKQAGFVIYPGKISQAETFRIGNIGEVYAEDIDRLVQAVKTSMYWR
ncbi:2-aminoethylphosphonate--pyruvate transaminase [Brevibacillus borstelensis]|jgi:2-aminoethylphosphonate-pyruvate transaminase|uniref:2-aminoethylphosphonate--pyruvate transaminase n=1 Tax=Brevibacillus borstelensis TaxID=45462 RepID=UPI003D1C4E49